MTFELITGTPDTPGLGNVLTNFGFSEPFVFDLATRTGGSTDRQTDRRTDGQDS